MNNIFLTLSVLVALVAPTTTHSSMFNRLRQFGQQSFSRIRTSKHMVAPFPKTNTQPFGLHFNNGSQGSKGFNRYPRSILFASAFGVTALNVAAAEASDKEIDAPDDATPRVH